jgi:transglutaminase-like putative cysteine protease
MTGQVRLTVFAALATLLATASLAPVLSTGPWIGPCFLAIVVVATSAAGMRWLHAPRWAAIAVALACLLLLLTQLFAHGVAALGLFPGPAAWQQLDATVHAGMDVLWAQAPPVTPTRGVTLIMAAAVGLVAIAVDTLAVTFRHAALAGVPLLALYLVPSAVVDGGAPWPVFALTAIGWLMLLVADSRSRLRRWGRTLTMRDTVEGNTPVDIALGASGRRIGAAAVVTALALPLLLPFLSDGMFGNGTGGDHSKPSSSPSQGASLLDPVASLRRDLTRTSNSPVFTYLSSDTTPAYFRLATLTEFNGTSWEAAAPRADAPPQPERIILPAAVSAARHSTIRERSVFSDITVDAAYADKRLPLPITAQTVSNAGGRWLVDLNTGDVYAEVPERTTASLHYQVESTDLQPTATQLRAAGSRTSGRVVGLGPDAAQLLDVPDATRRELQPYLADLGVNANAYDQAVAIQDWLRGFTYDLGPAKHPTTGDDLGAFLTDQRGYCQQFAAVMALMSRMSGIPARVAIGFTPGSAEDTAPRRWTVTWHDAHAWPELWFAGIGWVRFEPTPAGNGTGAGLALPGYAVPPAVSGNRHNHGDNGKPKQATTDVGPGRVGQGGTDQATDTSTSTPFDWAPWILAAVLVGCSLFLLPALVRRRLRTQRQRQTEPRLAIEAAWAEVIDTATDLELDPQTVESPRDLATRLRKHAGLSASVVPAMTRLSRAVERARYAATPGPVDDLWADAMIVCDSMTSYAGPHRARLARWWPASGRAELRRRWRTVTDRVDLVQEATINRVSRRGAARATTPARTPAS